MENVLDARDKYGNWFVAEILKVESNQVLVHFAGWSSKWDDWIDEHDTERLVVLATHTNGKPWLTIEYKPIHLE